ncbi:NAD(P)/FAD-dependent oxidoreductase [Actinokineospora cianjurensis]|uniref:NADH dehydrogenase FAD-containing subunit n=1 Tax=Actinokineospora cianjurensis TaxID=585224 RepID=A0A421BCB4_9PSEU|nr:FAD-dependent oxidoreductase [Actinokineospora cianjurensis]RLK62009.1 NADH dehydrogenase FAD-containing subunit [Actinokineospora cianjurensis]
MAQRIVVVGAGYAGLSAAGRVARTLGRRVEVTVVNPSPLFVERVRLHQVAVGKASKQVDLRAMLEKRGISFVLGAATALEPDSRRLLVGTRELDYDFLVYAAGSTGVVHEHALTVSGAHDTEVTRARLAELSDGAGVTVVGGGATGIEVATELAEARRDLVVRLVTGEELGAWLSPRGRDHLRAVLGRMGVEVHETKAVETDPGGVTLATGAHLPGEATIWSTGFTVPTLARDAGLAVDNQGRVLVDDTLRSQSHDTVYAAGDATALPGNLRMACATALPSGQHVAANLTARVTDRTPGALDFSYVAQCLSLGRRDALLQPLNPDDTPRPRARTGRTAALAKESIVRAAALAARHPGPLLPVRPHRT